MADAFSSAGVGRTGTLIAMYRQSCPRPASIDPSRVKAMPEDPLGPLPVEFQDDQVLVDIDSMKMSRYGLVYTFEQYKFLYGQYGKMTLEEAMAKPDKVDDEVSQVCF